MSLFGVSCDSGCFSSDSSTSEDRDRTQKQYLQYSVSVKSEWPSPAPVTKPPSTRGSMSLVAKHTHKPDFTAVTHMGSPGAGGLPSKKYNLFGLIDSEGTVVISLYIHFCKSK